MATYTDHHQAFHDNWGRSDLPSDHEDPQGVSIPEVLNHGSISFGKYAAESLAWEKWSVFSHNRCQEELEKFNGLVAQKKAYFEEYYRRIRALKAAEAEAQKQETNNHPESYQDDLTATSGAEESIDDPGSKEEEQTSDVSGIRVLDTGKTDLNLSGDSIENNNSEVADQQRSYRSSSNGEASVGDEVDISLPAVEIAHSPETASPEPVSWTNGSLEAAQQNDLVSDTDMVDLNSSKHQDQAPVLKPQGTVASAKDRAELDCRTQNDERKPSERLKPTSQKKLAGNAQEKVQLSRKNTPKPAGNMRPNPASSSHRPLLPGNADDKLHWSRRATPKPAGNTRPNSASSHRSSLSGNAYDKLQPSRKTTPKPAGNIRTNSASSHRLPTEVPTRATVLRSSIAGYKSASSVSSIRSVQTNTSPNPKVLLQKSTSRLPVNTLRHSSVHSTPKEITIKGGTRNVARKSVDITSCSMTPKREQSEKQRPKAMSTNLPTHIKSNQDSRIELLHGSYDREHQKEGKDQINGGQRRYPMRGLSNAPSIHKPPSPRPKKITPLQYTELMRSQREPRPKTSCWR